MSKNIPEENIRELIFLSHKYGADHDYVLAGGGNTSWKSIDVMAVKASGMELGTIGEDGFVLLDMDKLRDITAAEYPENREEREEQALTDLMATRLSGERGRPSVESLLHALIPVSYVVHTHPSLVNGLTCSVNGEKKAQELFPDNCVWIPLVDPGYILAKTVRERLSKWADDHDGLLPDYVFLANHGVFLWGESSKEIEEKYGTLFTVLKKAVFDPTPVETDKADTVIGGFLEKIGTLAGKEGKAFFTTGREIRELVKTRESAAPLMNSLSPDHIVYMGHTPLFYENIPEDQLTERIEKDYTDFTDTWGKDPKSILIQGRGFISIGSNRKSAEYARLLMLDAMRIIRISKSFGGPKFMTEEKVNFINTWEVEKYRAKLAEK